MKVGDIVFIWWASSDGVRLRDFELMAYHKAWGFQIQSGNLLLWEQLDGKNAFTTKEKAEDYLKTLL
jgi:hypothetical protein